VTTSPPEPSEGLLDFNQLVYYTGCMKIERKIIGSFEAKTHLASLIEDVRRGNEYTITRRGKPVAKLVPYRDAESDVSSEDIISRFDPIRKSVKGKVSIKEYIDEGRKY